MYIRRNYFECSGDSYGYSMIINDSAIITVLKSLTEDVYKWGISMTETCDRPQFSITNEGSRLSLYGVKTIYKSGLNDILSEKINIHPYLDDIYKMDLRRDIRTDIDENHFLYPLLTEIRNHGLQKNAKRFTWSCC